MGADPAKRRALFWIITRCVFVLEIGAVDLFTGRELSLALF